MNMRGEFGKVSTIRFEHTMNDLERKQYRFRNFLNGVSKGYYTVTYDPVIHENVRMSYGGLHQMEIMVTDISFGVL